MKKVFLMLVAVIGLGIGAFTVFAQSHNCTVVENCGVCKGGQEVCRETEDCGACKGKGEVEAFGKKYKCNHCKGTGVRP